jgi:hypothetical protein
LSPPSSSSDDDDDDLEDLPSKKPSKRGTVIRIEGGNTGDLSRLTKRQRMAIESQAQKQARVTEIGRHNKDALLRGAQADEAFFSLGYKKPKSETVV